MVIQVTQKHIDSGVRGSCSSDPIALAMREAGLDRPHVGPTYITWRKNFKDYSIETPPDVLGFMESFDNKMWVRPLTFELSE